ncbi:type III secretion system effector OspD3, partial [Shigella flexneri]|nr:type III secretion system effector OspD3 [Shigella flexneri]
MPSVNLIPSRKICLQNMINKDNVSVETIQSLLHSKQLPYFSDKRSFLLNLNCQVTDHSGRLIVCRHLASYWIAQFNKSSGHVDYHHFAFPDEIKNYVSVSEEEKAINVPAIIYFVENGSWGDIIFYIFNEMIFHSEKSRALEISTSNHNMALGLKIKETKNGGDFVIQLYDPNHTATHLRAEFNKFNLAKIKKLTVDNFLDEKHQKCYGLISDGMSIFVDRHTPTSMSSIIRWPDNLLHPKVIYHAMRMGLTELIQKVTRVVQLSDLSDNTLELLLAAKNDDGLSGLLLALQNGHSDTILAYGELLETSGLNLDKTVELLTAEGMGGRISGLSQALQNGHAETIKTYGRLLKKRAINIEYNKLKNLLTAYYYDEVHRQIPGLMFALQNGHADAIRAYGELILSPPLLNSEDIVNLLASRRYDNVPGLLLALNNGQADAILAYGDILNEAKLNLDKKAELLEAKDSNGLSGLFVALHNGCVETIIAYGKILHTADLTPHQASKLLAAEGPNGVSGLIIAFQNRNFEAIKTYMGIIKNEN